MRPDLPDATRYFEPWLDRWGLEPDGPPTATRTGRFLPVLYRSRPAMLKVVTEPEERDGARVLTWWAAEGAVRLPSQNPASAAPIKQATTEVSTDRVAVASSVKRGKLSRSD